MVSEVSVHHGKEGGEAEWFNSWSQETKTGRGQGKILPSKTAPSSFPQ
jgi:hypothetical protein